MTHINSSFSGSDEIKSGVSDGSILGTSADDTTLC